jgi:hypothetical protein
MVTFGIQSGTRGPEDHNSLDADVRPNDGTNFVLRPESPVNHVKPRALRNRVAVEIAFFAALM